MRLSGKSSLSNERLRSKLPLKLSTVKYSVDAEVQSVVTIESVKNTDTTKVTHTSTSRKSRQITV